jgi:tRNA G10  N-methylase Trm11
LTPPVALLHGDCTDPSIRQAALTAIGGGPFDCILTDPPYGIRESLLEKRPIDDLLDMIRDDRDAGRPLLRQDGRLVVYLPQSNDEPLWTHVLPTAAKMEEAGLRLELTRKQYLSDVLNRWLVSFVCVS